MATKGNDVYRIRHVLGLTGKAKWEGRAGVGGGSGGKGEDKKGDLSRQEI